MAEFMQGGDRSRRDLERRAAADSVDVQAQAALLRKREQAGGENAPKNIELAAYLGEPSARELLGDKAPEQGEEVQKRQQLGGWVQSLEGFGGSEPLLRAALASARSTFKVFKSGAKENMNQEEAALRQALELLETYFLKPEAVRQEELSAARDTVEAAAAQGADAMDAAQDADAAARAAQAAASAAQAASAAVWAAAYAVRAAAEAGSREEAQESFSPELRSALEQTNGNVFEAIQRIISAELIEWSIGKPEDDPVRKRVEARAKKAEEGQSENKE